MYVWYAFKIYACMYNQELNNFKSILPSCVPFKTYSINYKLYGFVVLVIKCPKKFHKQQLAVIAHGFMAKN